MNPVNDNLIDKMPRCSVVNDDEELIPSIFAQLIEPNQSAGRVIDRFFRDRYIALFERLEGGYIIVRDALGEVHIGDKNADLRCVLTLHNMKSYTQVALGGSNGSAQAYIDGHWSVDNLSHLVRIFVSNRIILDQMDRGLTRVVQRMLKVWHRSKRNTRRGSERNIAAHYDLGNDFFRLFLDHNMMYSSAIYQSHDDLFSASDRKLHRVCETLALSAEDEVVEIGSGWGGLACYVAANYGCKVTTITISKEQYEETQARAKRKNLEHLVEVRLQDYRDIRGQYDKLISIEMIEAIGHEYQKTYFNQINRLLKPNGKALIQAIVIDDSQYQRALRRVDYIKQYIFPGGFMPCYSVLMGHAARSRLVVEDVFDMGLSYAKTLRDWRKRFYANIQEVSQQGFGPEFQRMWEFYLCYCEGAFDERAISAGQLLFRKQAPLRA